MYKQYYGLTRKPFDLTPDPDVVYMGESHQEAMAVLRYGVLSGKGFLLLTGEVGTGKTTLLRALTCSLEENVHLCMLNNPTLTRDEFFALLAHEYKLDFSGNKALFLVAFGDFLRESYAKGERVLLIVDEAHVLPIDLLEEIRLLSNQDQAGQEVFSIFLVGQPELNDRLLDSRLLPLRQRIGMRFHLERFFREETGQYISYRLRQAGARHLNLFAPSAVDLIHSVSGGTPRLINIVCDHALLTGFSADEPVINADIIRECVQELHFPGEEGTLPLAPVQEKTTGGFNFLKLILIALPILVIALLTIEIVPSLRQYSPLSLIISTEWLHKLHELFDFTGGRLG